jgi:hypothetical protein
MKLQYRHWMDNEWHNTTFQELKQVLRNASPTDRYEVRKECNHKDTFIDGGIKICKRCGEHLEVTSWRD